VDDWVSIMNNIKDGNKELKTENKEQEQWMRKREYMRIHRQNMNV